MISDHCYVLCPESKMEQLIINETSVKSDLINHLGQKYPQIVFNDGTIVKPSIATGLLRSVFIEDERSFSKRLFQQFRSNGFFAMLEMLISAVGRNRDQSNIKVNGNNVFLKIFYFIALIIVHVKFVYLKIHYYFYPFDKFSDDELLQQFNPNLDWHSGLIRTFEWHPNSLRCALALTNDLIYIYSADEHRPLNYVCCLKNIAQKRVSSLAWHPKRDDVLIVACENRILLWKLQSNLKDFKVDISCLKTICTRLSSPIVSVAFDLEGNSLVACSPRNSSLAVIKFDDKLDYTVHRETKLFFSQFTSLLWSPDKTRLLAHTTTNKICILEKLTWSYRCWKSNLDSLCHTSVWSRPSGKILLFTPKESSKVFAVIFYDKAEAGDVGGGPDCSTLVLDTSEQHFGEDIHLGVCINQLAWDRNSTCLAISFQDKRDLIALYGTRLTPSLQIWPHSTIRCGFERVERCLLIRFHDYYIDSGCLLSVCWSNGMVSHIPLATDDHSNSGNRSEQSLRSLTTLCTSFTARGANDSSQLCVSPTSPQVKKIIQSPIAHPTPATTQVFSPRRTTLFSTRVKLD